MSNRFSPIDPNTLGPLTLVQVPDKEALIKARMADVKDRWTFYDPPFGAAYDVENLEFDPIKISQEAGTSQQLNALSFVNAMGRSTTLAFGFGDNLDAIATRMPGGVPRLNKGLPNQEGDEAYAYRIWLASNKFGTAGAALAYVAIALDQDVTLKDATAVMTRDNLLAEPIVILTLLPATQADLRSAAVQMPVGLSTAQTAGFQAAIKPVPGWAAETLKVSIGSPVFEVTFADQPVPSRDLVFKVRAALADPNIGPLSDLVSVQGPDVLDYAIDVGLALNRSADAFQSLAAVMGALVGLKISNDYLGVDLNLMQIERACAQYGVENCSVRSPALDVPVDDTQKVRITGIRVTIDAFANQMGPLTNFRIKADSSIGTY